MEENKMNQTTELYNDPIIILTLLNVNLGLIQTVENINQQLDMSNSNNRLYPQVYTKNILENCRSALDYMANLIVKRYNITINPKSIYFPICKTQKKFEENRILSFLEKENTELFGIIKNVQPCYKRPDSNWLDIFNDMNNDYKHNGFTPLESRFGTGDGGWCAMSHCMSLGKMTLNLTEEKTGIKTVTTTDFQNDRMNKFWFVFADKEEELVPFLRKTTDETYKLIDKILKILN